MKTNHIDPSHIWDIRDENLDVTSKALLVRLAGLQHLDEIWISNATLAADLNVSRRTVVQKMKVLTTAGYIPERRETNELTQTKFTKINKDFTIQKILESSKGSRLTALKKHYGVCRETKEKSPLPVPRSTASQYETLHELALTAMEQDILS